jgi:hypothetical protein
MRKDPLISVVVAARNMERELPRTLHTLTPSYQTDVDGSEYEVIVVDCGSRRPIDPAMVSAFGPNFRLERAEDAPSPARAINHAVASSCGRLVMICIDGARMLSPGILRLTLAAFRAYRSPTVATLAWHLGPKPQALSMLEGYCQSVEDQLLESIDWRSDGYELFRVSALAESSSRGWFGALAESNCITLQREAYASLQGFDERFNSPGGGFVNLDFYARACDQAEELVIVLGEGTFHQFHGGAATNIPLQHPDRTRFSEEYRRLKLTEFVLKEVPTTYIGSLPRQTLPFLEISVAAALRAQGPLIGAASDARRP